MRISVVIPTHNRAGLVLRALESVFAQSHKADEIIVVDDGSSDETAQVLKQVKNIRVIQQENSGVSAARNKGIEISSSDWIAFLDSDDVWHKDKLKLQVDFHKTNPDILFSHTGEQWVKDDKIVTQKAHHKKPSGDCFLDNLNFCKIAPSSVMIKKEVFEKVGYFDESLEVCEDYDMWLRVLYRYHVGLLDDKLVTKFAGHKDQLSCRYFGMDRFRILALEKHLDSQYHVEVQEEIIKKCRVLVRGAVKHKNEKIYEEYVAKLRRSQIKDLLC